VAGLRPVNLAHFFEVEEEEEESGICTLPILLPAVRLSGFASSHPLGTAAATTTPHAARPPQTASRALQVVKRQETHRRRLGYTKRRE
jgi:hypothetical protein